MFFVCFLKIVRRQFRLVSDGRAYVGQPDQARAGKVPGRHEKVAPEFHSARNHVPADDEIRPEGEL